MRICKLDEPAETSQNHEGLPRSWVKETESRTEYSMVGSPSVNTPGFSPRFLPWWLLVWGPA